MDPLFAFEFVTASPRCGTAPGEAEVSVDGTNAAEQFVRVLESGQSKSRPHEGPSQQGSRLLHLTETEDPPLTQSHDPISKIHPDGGPIQGPSALVSFTPTAQGIIAQTMSLDQDGALRTDAVKPAQDSISTSNVLASGMIETTPSEPLQKRASDKNDHSLDTETSILSASVAAAQPPAPRDTEDSETKSESRPERNWTAWNANGFAETPNTDSLALAAERRSARNDKFADAAPGIDRAALEVERDRSAELPVTGPHHRSEESARNLGAASIIDTPSVSSAKNSRSSAQVIATEAQSADRLSYGPAEAPVKTEHREPMPDESADQRCAVTLPNGSVPSEIAVAPSARVDRKVLADETMAAFEKSSKKPTSEGAHASVGSISATRGSYDELPEASQPIAGAPDDESAPSQPNDARVIVVPRTPPRDSRPTTERSTETQASHVSGAASDLIPLNGRARLEPTSGSDSGLGTPIADGGRLAVSGGSNGDVATSAKIEVSVQKTLGVAKAAEIGVGKSDTTEPTPDAAGPEPKKASVPDPTRSHIATAASDKSTDTALDSSPSSARNAPDTDLASSQIRLFPMDQVSGTPSLAGKTFEGTAAASPPPALVTQQIAVAALADTQRETQIDVTLSPEELGRVRLRLHHGESGLSVSIVTERAETLDLLRRNIDLLAHDFESLGYGDVSFSFGEQAKDRAPDRPPEESNQNSVRREPAPIGATLASNLHPMSPGTPESGLDLRM